MIGKIDVQITTPLNPTERRDRVETAITNLFPSAEIEERHGELVAETHTLDRFAERLEEQDIVDTAREMLYANLSGDTVSVELKKQAAHEGVVNFAVGTPDELGEIVVRVRIEEPDPETVIDRLAPSTGAESDDRPGA